MSDDQSSSLRRAFEDIAASLRESATQKTMDRKNKQLSRDLQIVSEILAVVHDVEKEHGLPAPLLEIFAELAVVASVATPEDNLIRSVMLEDSTFSVVKSWEDISLVSQTRLPKALAARWPTFLAKEAAAQEQVRNFLGMPREWVTVREDDSWYLSFKPPHLPPGASIPRGMVEESIAKQLDSEADACAFRWAERERDKEDKARATRKMLQEEEQVREAVKAGLAKIIYGASDEHVADVCPIELAKDVAKWIQSRIRIPCGVAIEEGWKYVPGNKPKVPGGIRVKTDCVEAAVWDAVKEFVYDTGVAHVAKTTVTIDSRTYWQNSQTGQYAVAYTVHMGPYSVTLEPIHI